MWRTALTQLHLRNPETLCLVLGGETFRYAIAGADETLQSESAIGNRWRDTKVIVAIGDERSSCHRWTEREWVHLFGGEVKIDAQFLARLCAGMRRRMLGFGRRKMPMRLLVTGRPDLMERVAPLLAEAAKLYFRSTRIVPEHRCLARAARDEGLDAMLVDAGHFGTRVYDRTGGQTTGSEAASGKRMRETINDIAVRRHNLHIGQLNALRLLRELDAPTKWPVHFKGRDCLTGLPREAAMERAFVLEALSSAFTTVAQVCEQALSAHNSSGGRRQQVVLAGGCAELQELRSAVEARLRLPTISLAYPAEASLRGLCELVDEGMEG